MKRADTNYSIFDYFVMAIFVSFLGFMVEDIWIAFHEGYVDNRNMNLPFLIGYGLAITLMWVFFGTPDRKHLLSYFSKCFLFVSVGEFLLGNLVELTCGIYYWDYTSLPLHVSRYTSLFTSLFFSLIITLFMWKIFCPLMDLIHAHDSRHMHVISTIVISILLFDFIYSFAYMYSNQSYYDSWRLILRG